MKNLFTSHRQYFELVQKNDDDNKNVMNIGWHLLKKIDDEIVL